VNCGVASGSEPALVLQDLTENPCCLPTTQERVTFRHGAVEVSSPPQDIHQHGALRYSLLAILKWLQRRKTLYREPAAKDG
jgi:hypothetical protein